MVHRRIPSEFGKFPSLSNVALEVSVLHESAVIERFQLARTLQRNPERRNPERLKSAERGKFQQLRQQPKGTPSISKLGRRTIWIDILLSQVSLTQRSAHTMAKSIGGKQAWMTRQGGILEETVHRIKELLTPTDAPTPLLKERRLLHIRQGIKELEMRWATFEKALDLFMEAVDVSDLSLENQEKAQAKSKHECRARNSGKFSCSFGEACATDGRIRTRRIQHQYETGC
ncbi:hypothetical protein Aduo_016480 [Ancylostoma duodenale]